MIRFFTKQKGAVSIFLALVLVPMLVVASVFVDTSRLKLGEAMATSAGDLTLNAALTDYDTVLKDIYGLFATSQSIDQIYDNLRTYFQNSMTNSGVDAITASEKSNQIIQWFSMSSELGTSDLMNISIDTSTIEFESLAGANLLNPSVFKSQIVEFMKYRAPIDLAGTLLDALDTLKSVDKQTDLVSKKNEFYTAQAGVLADLESAWREICTYQYNLDPSALVEMDTINGHSFPKKAYFESRFAELDQSYEVLQGNSLQEGALWKAIVAFLYEPEGFYSPDVLLQYSSSHMSGKKHWEVVEKGRKQDSPNIYSDTHQASSDDLLRLMNSCESARKNLEDYIAEWESYSFYASYADDFHKGGRSLDEAVKIALVHYFNRSSSDELSGRSYMGKVKSYVTELLKLENAFQYWEENDETTWVIYSGDQWELSSDNMLDAKAIHDAIEDDVLNHLWDDDDEYEELSIYHAISQMIDRLAGNQDERSVGAYVDSAKSFLDSSLGRLSRGAVRSRVLIHNRILRLDKALGILSAIKSKMGEGGEYAEAISAWKSSANALGSRSSMGKSELKEIESVNEFLNLEDITALISRLQNVKYQLNIIEGEICKYQLDDNDFAFLCDANHVPLETQVAFRTALGDNHLANLNRLHPIASKEAYLEEANSIRSGLQKGTMPEWEDSADPNLENDSPALFTWLKNNFGTNCVSEDVVKVEKINQTAQGKEEAQKVGDDAKKEMDDKKDEAIVVSQVERKASDNHSLPSADFKPVDYTVQEIGSSQDNNALLSNSASGLTALLGILENVVEDLRDYFFIIDYAMRMFSYNTMEAELVRKTGETEGLKAWYTATGDNGAYKLRDDLSDKEKTAVQEAKTLTLVPIEPNLNYLYGKEVEYIIFGGDNCTAVTNTMIYLLRFGLNLVHAFTDKEILKVASSVAAICCPPPITALAPLAKLAVIVGLALAESGWDLYRLHEGYGVPLMKTDETWVMKPSTALKKASEELISFAIDEGAKKVQNILDEILLMGNAELKEILDAGEDRVRELAESVIDAEMSRLQDTTEEVLSKTVDIINQQDLIWTKNHTDAKVLEYNTEKEAVIKRELQNWLATQNTGENDEIYRAKKTAVEYLINNSGSPIKGIMEAIKQDAEAKEGDSILQKKLKEVSVSLKGQLDSSLKQIGKYGDDMVDRLTLELRNAGKQGVDKLKDSLKGHIHNVIGSGEGEDTSIVSSITDWRYSNYLTLFLLISLIRDQQGTLLRMEDLVTMNMRHIRHEFITEKVTKSVPRLFGLFYTEEQVEETHETAEAFTLAKAYTYIKMKAKVQVKPLFLVNPLFKDYYNETKQGNWYTFDFSASMGY